MIRNLLATTAIATLVATGAYAQTTTTTEPTMQTEQAAPQVKHAEGHLASNLIGETVYNGTGDDAENIGSVTDMVISNQGQIEALVVGVGGFLGIGRKDVALEFSVAEWAERDGDEWLVIPTNREALEALPEFDRSAFTPQDANAEVGNTTPATGQDIGVAATGAGAAATAPTNDTTATAPAVTAPATTTDTTSYNTAANDTVVTDTDDTATAAIDRSTLNEVDAGTMSADNIIGTTVYGANDENVGEISDVLLSQDGGVDAVIIDVGGFLGIGQKSVAVSMENLAFMADGDANHYLYTSMTKEQLEAQPEYDEGTFAENRDGQLLVVPAQ
ncbi:PRC-barrel domain-containing protein [Aquamicrobium zhengzhouense]|uniref:PRC-barrel domain-containing protein n=1 Tax=Aquamicrobium zhengzhouense TaxID=2781738 RepID=A0ABS0SDQ9_9HYPH|nr:PRC-barrel domain-containing protein [Aquamicrobium zhengzhouense]MBI1621411.1 PRC-barrel domain-containing protein [Aquamicrobium zhengzhouense]